MLATMFNCCELTYTVPTRALIHNIKHSHKLTADYPILVVCSFQDWLILSSNETS